MGFEYTMPSRKSTAHCCSAQKGRKVTFMIYLTSSNVYQGVCPLCNQAVEEDLTGSETCLPA